MSEAAIDTLLMECPEDLICVGHTHQPFTMEVNRVQIINPGSVSNPFGSDVRASYAIITVDENGYDVDFYRAAYPQQEVIDILERIRHPARRFIIQHMRGERGTD